MKWGNDERTEMLTLEEIDKVLSIADPEFRPVVGLALTTGIDQGPLRMMLVSDYNEAMSTLVVRDTKTIHRPRTLMLAGEPVLKNSEFWLRQLGSGRGRRDPMCSFTKRQIQIRWEAIREKIGRPHLRWKDLRGVFATYYLLAGGDPRTLQRVLGHAGMAMTLRYLRHLPVGNRDRLREQARTMGTWHGGVKLEDENAA